MSNNIFLNEEQFQEIFSAHVKISTYTKPIKSIFLNNRKLKKINYKPYYQRNYVWDDDKATYFIESILLGTEIPPLIFFKESKVTEIIDGRQRFETIKRFLDKEFSLSKNGLTALTDLVKNDLESLRQHSIEVYQLFLDAKVRIIEFELVNQPPSDPDLIDKLKKEIFGRYNSGITPLRKAEIDNAIYDSDSVSKYFKEKLESNLDQRDLINELFLRQIKSTESPDIEKILQFIRKSLVLFRFPIKHYATGKERTELIRKFYQYIYEEHQNPSEIYEKYIEKINFIGRISQQIQDLGASPNRLFLECILWSVNILEQEEVDFYKLEDKVTSIAQLLKDNSEKFELSDSHYYKETLDRFSTFQKYIKKELNVHISQYVQGNTKTTREISKIRSMHNDSGTELAKLKSLRITKPDPSRLSIEDVHSDMLDNRFLVRPSYQRSEVIDLTKASALIESILLGIPLPAIFIYKRDDGISEVIDGQQRLLTILGFSGKQYLDENGKLISSKNSYFKLKNLRILRHLDKLKFEELDEDLQDKILDFELLIVEIAENLNPEFNPVDLFIRLNDKPFPIKVNSFEMWNSWVHKEVIDAIKKVFDQHRNWFFIRNVSPDKIRDRMLNEELITTLACFDYLKRKGRSIDSFLDIYQRGDRINARVKSKKSVTSLLQEITASEEKRLDFMDSIDNKLNLFIEKVSVLLHADLDKHNDLKERLDTLLSSGSTRKYPQRNFQDFYMLWHILDDLKNDFLNKPSTYSDIEGIFKFMKSIPKNMSGNRGYEHLKTLIENLKTS